MFGDVRFYYFILCYITFRLGNMILCYVRLYNYFSL